MIRRLFCITFLIIPFSSFADDARLDLKSCFAHAKENSAAFKATATEIDAARGRFSQAIGSVLPQFSLKASDQFQDDPGASGSSVPSSFVRTERPEVALNGKWTLFQGLKEYQAIKLANVDERRAAALRSNAERLLWQDVSSSFLAVATLEQDQKTVARIAKVLDERAVELRRRVALGKSRLSEQLSQETDLELLQAELLDVENRLAVAYETLSFLTGLTPQPRITWSLPAAGSASSLETYLTAVDQRADLVAARADVDLARGAVSVSRGDLLPQLDAEGNYYLYRVGYQEDVLWDASLKLSVPLFNWGVVGNTREAAAKSLAADWQYADLKQRADREIRTAYQSYAADQRQLDKFQSAARKAEQSYQSEVDDFRRGLVTNLEVMQSQRTWLEALRKHNSAELQTWLDWLNLELAVGRMAP